MYFNATDSGIESNQPERSKINQSARECRPAGKFTFAFVFEPRKPIDIHSLSVCLSRYSGFCTACTDVIVIPDDESDDDDMEADDENESDEVAAGMWLLYVCLSV